MTAVFAWKRGQMVARRALRIGLVCGSVLGAVAACGGTPPDPRAETAGPPPKVPMYCYRNLGEPTCFAEPVPRDEDRLFWYRGPHPETYRED